MEQLERQLDSFEPRQRQDALGALVEKWRTGEIELPEPGSLVNLHIHSFYSYNAYGYSPSKAAWLAKQHGLAVAGIMDFDTLEGAAELFDAAAMLEVKACVGMETRVFVPEFGERVMNSPGEPGIAYHMGYGFTTAALRPDLETYRSRLQNTAQERNRVIVGRVNPYLSPVELDYDAEVDPITPGINVTERHICRAYARKAEATFGGRGELAGFWAGKLDIAPDEFEALDDYGLQSLIRKRTMKSGGVGYVAPDRGSFPKMAEYDRFVLDAGAIPVLAWLDGTSEGERHYEELCEIAIEGGVAALSCIPDLRYASSKDAEREKLANLYKLFELAEKLGLPMIAGTEMNIPGQRFVDDFGSDELAPLLPYVLKSARIFYGHTVLQRRAGLGYTSEWAERMFADRAERNKFFERVGEELRPGRESLLDGIGPDASPGSILSAIRAG